MFSSVLLASSLLALVSCADHQIVVGGAAGKVFTPSTVNAAIGDTVSFVFESLNHTVTQSAFSKPCALLQNATTGKTGFDSGFVPVAVGATSSPVWTLEVTVATPIWFYCKQATHCSAGGMVGGINIATTGNKTFAAFQALAKSQPQVAGTATGGASGVGAAATGGLSTVASPTGAYSGSGSAAGSGYGSGGYGSSGSGSSNPAAAGGASISTSGGIPITTAASSSGNILRNSVAGIAVAAMIASLVV